MKRVKSLTRNANETFLGSVFQLRATELVATVLVTLVALCGSQRVLAQSCTGNQTTSYDPAKTTLVRVSGTLSDVDSGSPVLDASVTVRSTTVCSDSNGFLIHSLQKRNASIIIRHPDYYTEVIPAQLNTPGTNVIVSLGRVRLQRRLSQPGSARMLFGGDVALGRRYFDPAADQFYPRTIVPPDTDGALIQTSNPESGTAQVVSGLSELYADESSDFQVLNLETPVLNNPATPHTAKDHAFFTLPGSLTPLKQMGLDYVSLGNNHVYDYLQHGIVDTLDFVTASGLASSGAGRDVDEAFAPFHYGKFSFLSFSSLSGSQFGDPDLELHASETKGGSADLADYARVDSSISSERAAGMLPITQLHTGKEYTYQPSEFAASRMRSAANSGAALVVGHHPHVAQGFGSEAGVPIIHSLGNLVFDSDRLETVLGLTVFADFENGAVRKLTGAPIYIEDYQPKPLTGALGNRMIRRLGEHSWSGVVVYPETSRARVVYGTEGYTHTVRTVTCTVTVGLDGVGIMDLRSDVGSACRIRSHESLRTLEVVSGSPTQLHVGRDVMLFGEMEDYDVDSDNREASEWYLEPGSLKVCSSGAHSGMSGICSSRSFERTDDSVLKFRKRMRVVGDADDVPVKDLTLLGYMQADNSGATAARATYQASEGDREFGSEEISLPSGTFGWTRVTVDLNMPEEFSGNQVRDPKTDQARAVVLTLRQSPPAAGSGIVRYDDFSLVNWEKSVPTLGRTTFKYPNIREYVRLRGAPGVYGVKVSFRSTRTN